MSATTTNTTSQNGGQPAKSVSPHTEKPTAHTWGKKRDQIEDTASRMPDNRVRPEWTDCKGITRIFGIHKSTIYRLEAEGLIRTSSLRARNKLRGKKLINCDSVAAYIERMATGGEEVEP